MHHRLNDTVATLALCALAAGGVAARADATLHNDSGQGVYLNLTKIDFANAVVRLQVFMTGKTPAVTTQAMVLEDTKAGTKAFLNDRLADEAGEPEPPGVKPRVYHLTNTTVPSEVGLDGVLILPDKASLTFKVLTGEADPTVTNRVTFKVMTPPVTPMGEANAGGLVDEYVDVVFKAHLDRHKGPVATLTASFPQPLDNQGKPLVHRLDCKCADPDADLWVLKVRTPPGCCCAVM